MLAACVGVLTPMRDVWLRARGATCLASARLWQSAWPAIVLWPAAAACLGVTTVILLAAPQSAILGRRDADRARCCFCCPFARPDRRRALPACNVFSGLAQRALAVIELRSPETRTRSLAIAATRCGCSVRQRHDPGVADQSATRTRSLLSTAALRDRGSVGGPARRAEPARHHVVPRRRRCHAGAPSGCPRRRSLSRRLPRLRRSSYVGARAASVGRRAPIPPSQLVAGKLAPANARLRSGRLGGLSKTLAAQHHLHIGQSFHAARASDPGRSASRR